MLSYRHAFHAANHADALKHIALMECLGYLGRKDKGYLYVDTHAGAGDYRLDEGYAARNDEWANGLGRLGAAAAPDSGPEPGPVARYLAFVAAYGAGHGGAYPGSPAIAASLMRPQDRAALFELHPADHELLARRFAGDERLSARKADGYAGLVDLLPPPTRRGLVLVDPSYELASDYAAVVDAVGSALRRFATGVYAVWYPLLERDEAKFLPGKLLSLCDRRLHAWLRVRSLAEGERGMAGSGLVVLNPPWTLGAALGEALPYLARVLGQDDGADWGCESFE